MTGRVVGCWPASQLPVHACDPTTQTSQTSHQPEACEVDDVQRRDVVRLPSQVVLPEPLPPEPEAVHVLVVVAERRVTVRCALPITSLYQYWFGLGEGYDRVMTLECGLAVK